MEITIIVAVLASFFFSAFLKGVTGLGFSTVCLGILATLMDLKVAIPLVFFPSLFSNIMVMVEAGRFFEALKRFWLLYLSAVPGLLFGIWILDSSQGNLPKAVLGAVMTAYGVWGLRNGYIRLSLRSEKRLLLPIGITTGIVNGMTGSQIIPIMPYLLSLKIDKELFIQTINGAFTLNTLIMMAVLGQLGLLTSSVLTVSAMGIIPVVLGIAFGGRIRKNVSEKSYRKMVFLLLIVLGLSLMTRWLMR